ncbi:MAG: ketoacyl-ACP synthase III [Acidobacteria bacterium]|nr:MAG: ketoacyl-ACP synthase III [Acidobacteriota bacterium]REK02360.1 MAG: ketoacyl-ACP synthase III [Acidobacteriota bacterium]REK13838.1 MAG: ketoacyl-ACP synthase III [Acidobacteriota bacterium]REK41833.1 MAG: ketoacyl-ACP synthase III [Acidobacteriota bacterium]
MTSIKGTGCVLPDLVVPNSEFHNNIFYDKDGTRNQLSGEQVTAKLEAITGIRERRYVPFDQDSRPLMIEAAKRALRDSGLDPNEIDGIIVAHDSGNILVDEGVFHTVPNMGAYLKNALEITNHDCFAYDILFACPGWLQAVIQAHQAIKCGDANNVLVVGIEIASRMLDPHDVDSMILGDGCGAAVFSKDDDGKGILSNATFSHANEDLANIYLGRSNKKDVEGVCWFKMNGRDVYRYATSWVPKVVKKTLDKAGLGLADVDMFLFHQANEKLIEAMAKNLADLYEMGKECLKGKLPMTIQFLGNTSVASIPTMLDLILKGKLEGFEIRKGDTVVMASVGAGMHCNSIVYRF